MTQLDLTSYQPSGSTYVEKLDKVRLNRQQSLVYDAMKDGRWKTLQEIWVICNAPEASASARLRDLRKLGFTVERRRRGRALHEYRVTRP